MAEPTGNDDKQDPHTSSTQKDSPPKTLPSKISPNLDAIEPDEHSQKSDSENKPSPRLHIKDSIMVAATCVSAITAIIYTCFAGGQWKTLVDQSHSMKGQLANMSTQTNVAFKQLSAARGALKVAQATLEDTRKSAIEQNDRAERLTTANEKTARASVYSVETVKQIAKSSLDATINNFHSEQRAWVGVFSADISEYPGGKDKVVALAGEKITFAPKAINSGKTPALEVQSAYYILSKTPGEDPCKAVSTVVPHGSTNYSNEIVLPGMTVYLERATFPPQGDFTSIDIDDITKSKKIIYVTGIITYKDVFSNKPHFSKFCLMLSPSLRGFEYCNTCNEVDP